MRDLATSKSVLKLVPIKWKQDFLLNALCSLPSGPTMLQLKCSIYNFNPDIDWPSFLWWRPLVNILRSFETA